jgi:very-short-patch-repair endonuclease
MRSPIEIRLTDAIVDALEQRGIDELFDEYLQFPVESYRIDIMLEGTYGRLAVECDGFDFHDRTKQQAAYDRSRDRRLLMLGIPTIRFTGSEIVHDDARCAAEVIDLFIELEERARLLFEALRARCDRQYDADPSAFRMGKI